MTPHAVRGTTVSAEAAIALLEQLVSIPSLSGEEDAAATALVAWLREHGWEAARDEAGSAVGVRGAGPNELVLLGHIDTFPGTVPVRRDGNCLYGRGSVDAKGPLCTFAAAASAVDVPSDWRITVVGAVEEESTTSRGARHIVQQRVAATAPRYVIIGEPSRWDRVTLGYKGRLHLKANLRYPYSHSAGTGRLPAEAAVDLWRAIEGLCRERNEDRPTREFDRLTPSLLSIATEPQGAFGSAALHMGFRLPLADDPDTLEQDLRAFLNARISGAPSGTELDTTFSGAEVAHQAEKGTPLVSAFLRGIRQEHGSPRFVVKTGTSDMNVVAPAWPDTPIVAYGPGDSALDHTPNEHIELDEYLRAIGVLERVLRVLLADDESRRHHDIA
jgi:[amino group carrier protein]-lysine/ornithine hydrolase